MSINSITPCIEDGCPAYVYKNSRCRKHYTPFKGSGRAERLPRGWKDLAAAVKARDAYLCYVCGGHGADGVDHIVPAQDQPDGQDNNHPSNLAAIHHNVEPYCHRTKIAQEGVRARTTKPNRYPF